MNSSAPNINSFWADLIIEELVRNGIRQFFVAPGSRSSPLVVALAQHPVADATIHFDERGAAFAALGYGRASRHPAVWITTSGTAAANGLPAVIEATQAHVPMIALTADRPPELRDAGANQAIDQIHLFGSYPNWFFDLPCPTPAIDVSFVLTTVDQAVHRAVDSPAGPVHLNCPFREPLAPDADGIDLRSPPDRWYHADTPFTEYRAGTTVPESNIVSDFTRAVSDGTRGLIVAGELRSRHEARAVSALAAAIGWPVLADVASQMRLGDAPRQVVACPHFVSAALAHDAEPALILRFGGPLSSKEIQSLTDTSQARIITVQDHPKRRDPGHSISTVVHASAESFCEAVGAVGESPDAAWLEMWTSAGNRILSAVTDHLSSVVEISEPAIAATVARILPSEHALFAASSMPIRDLDMFGSSPGPLRRVAANRGVSGIDGTVASAFGYHLAANCPVTLLIGDLALLHDLNSMALLHDRPVTIVVINNGGGGIFNFLPIAEHPDVFEPWFTAPHGWSFEGAAGMFGIPYQRPDSAKAFEASYTDAVKSGGPNLLEVRTDRHVNRALHTELRSLALKTARSIGA